MNYHKDTGYLLEPEYLTSSSKEHLNAFETAYGLRVNDDARGEPLLMQRFRKRAATQPETIEIQVEENGRRVTYSAPQRLQPTPRAAVRPVVTELPARPVRFPLLPHWAEGYRSEIQALWKLTSAESATRTARLLFEKFGEFLRQRDWLGAEATLRYLETGASGRISEPEATAERGQAKKKKDRKPTPPVSFSLSQDVRDLFAAYAQRARATPEYRHQRESRYPDAADDQTN